MISLWFAYYDLTCGSIAFSLIVSILGCAFMLFCLNADRLFVIRNKSFEGPHGEGSPLAFLADLVFELFWFVYFSILTMIGVRLMLRDREERRAAASGAVQGDVEDIQ